MASSGSAKAPGQQAMLGEAPWWKGTKYDFPKGTPDFWANGIPWDTFQDGKPPPGKSPIAYEPPQWNPGYLCGGNCLFINWWQERSPLLRAPPCCCAWCMFKCCVRNSEYIAVAEPDAWMVKMLSTGTSPKCPEMMKGIWWLCDNNAPHEILMCFHDADWATEKIALKTYYHNYATGPTCEGAITQFGAALTGSMLRIELSPNNQWISIAGSSTPGWIYVDQSGDEYECKGEYAQMLYGKTFKPAPDGEWLRVSHKNEEEPLSTPDYQYRVRKIAYINSKNELVKTAAFADMKKRGTMPFYEGHKPCCCDYCFCLSKADLALGWFPQLPDTMVVRYAPPAPGAKAPE